MPTMAGTTRSQIVVLSVSLFVYALGRICQLYPDKVPALLIVILQVVPPAVFALVHGSILYRVKGMAVFTGFCLGVASISETLGLRTGFPFGHYHFTSLMGPKLLQMPVLLVLAYLGIGYCSWVLGLLILRNRDKPLMGARRHHTSSARRFDHDGLGSFHGPDLVDPRPSLDLARRRDVLWRSAQQLLRLVSDRVPVLSSFCALLQSQSGPTGPHVSLLLAVRRCLLRHLCFRKSPDLQKGIVSSSRSRRFGEALAHAGHSDCLRARLFICNGAHGPVGVAQSGASRREIGWKGINPLKTTKPGWFARLSFCGAGSIGLVSSVDPECRFTESPSRRRGFQPNLLSSFTQLLVQLFLFARDHRCSILTSPSPGSPTRAGGLAGRSRPFRRGQQRPALLSAKPHTHGPSETPGAIRLLRTNQSCPPGASRSAEPPVRSL